MRTEIIKFPQPRRQISGSIIIEKTAHIAAMFHFDAAERDYITVHAPDPDTAIKIYKESERLLIKDREKYVKEKRALYLFCETQERRS